MGCATRLSPPQSPKNAPQPKKKKFRIPHKSAHHRKGKAGTSPSQVSRWTLAKKPILYVVEAGLDLIKGRGKETNAAAASLVFSLSPCVCVRGRSGEG